MIKILPGLLLSLIFVTYDNTSTDATFNLCNVSCADGYQQICMHTWHCQPKPGCKLADVDYHFRNEMVHMHNYYRNEIALGKTPLPRASDMLYLDYDKHLEYLSQCYVNNCKANYTACNKTSTFPGYMGQNFITGRNLTDLSSRFVLNIWYDEMKSIAADERDRPPANISNNFTQIIWAKTKRFGCALSEDAQGVQYLICSYHPPLVRGESAYKEGNSCANCVQCNKQFEGLCGGMITNLRSGAIHFNYNFVYLLLLSDILVNIVRVLWENIVLRN